MDWQDIAKWLWGLLVPAGWWIFNKQDKRIDAVEASLKEKTDVSESEKHREYIAKLFEKIDEHSRRDEALFREVLTKMGDNQSELLRELNKKEDR